MSDDEGHGCLVYAEKGEVHLMVPGENGVVTISFAPSLAREVGEAMVEAWNSADASGALASLNPLMPIADSDVNRTCAKADLNAMLDASALTPGGGDV